MLQLGQLPNVDRARAHGRPPQVLWVLQDPGCPGWRSIADLGGLESDVHERFCLLAFLLVSAGEPREATGIFPILQRSEAAANAPYCPAGSVAGRRRDGRTPAPLDEGSPDRPPDVILSLIHI
eukprot:12133863-Alexandrium_andersonii.AAC.1